MVVGVGVSLQHTPLFLPLFLLFILHYFKYSITLCMYIPDFDQLYIFLLFSGFTLKYVDIFFLQVSTIAWLPYKILQKRGVGLPYFLLWDEHWMMVEICTCMLYIFFSRLITFCRIIFLKSLLNFYVYSFTVQFK